MARRLTKTERLIERFTAQFSSDIATEFRAAIADLKGTADYRTVVRLIEANDVEGVFQAIIDRAAFRPVERAIETAFETGGNGVASTFPITRDGGEAGRRAAFRFDVRNTGAEEWLRTHSGNLITRVVDDQRVLIRQVLDAGLTAGKNPRTVALDIIGRISRITGRREGGVIGLTSGQERYLANAVRELQSGTTADLMNYLTRQARDARFDPVVRRAIMDGTPIDAATRQRMIDSYSNRLLKVRGDTIGRSEAIEAMNKAQQEVYIQATEKGIVKQSTIKKEWDATGDSRTRDSHMMLDGSRVGLDQPFRSPATGALMMYPGDRSLGAHGEDTINCRCRVRYVVNNFVGVI